MRSVSAIERLRRSVSHGSGILSVLLLCCIVYESIDNFQLELSVNCFGRVIRYFCLAACFLGLSTSLLASWTGESRLPLTFEQNLGQAPKDVRYLMRRGALQGAFETNSVRLKLKTGPKNAEEVIMRLVGAQEDAAITGGGLMEGRTNYLVGNDSARWLRGVPNYAEVRYSEIYPGTNLLFYGNDGVLEHDFELMPGADPTHIAFRLDGSKKLTVAENGDLEMELGTGEIRFKKPIAYQMIDGSRRLVDAAFQLEANGSIHFKLGKYDPAAKLIIDPVLSFATYLSTYSGNASLIATDAAGNNYLSGVAFFGFPVTSGAFPCPDCSSSSGALTFISKLSPDGKKLLYSTVLGGNQFAQPTGFAVDAEGNAVVSGWTGASDFPTKNGQTINMTINGYFGFLVSLSADGSSLNYGTLLGSKPSTSNTPDTYASAVALDSSGNAYVVGITGDDFNVTSGALNQIKAGQSYNSFDVFLAKFSPTGTLLYGALLGTADPQNGGGGPIGPEAVAVDASGNAYVAGQAGILWPISSNAYLKQIAGSMPYATPFVMKVSADAKTQIYSTYLDYAYIVTGIAPLANGNLFVAGQSVGPNFPTTPNAYQTYTNEASFLTELKADGSGLAYSTTVGDSTYRINGMALDPNGDIWLAGQTGSTEFPLLDPIQGTFPVISNYPDGPVSVLDQFDPTGETLKFSTFLGGSAPGYASKVAVGADHKVHVAGAAGYGMYTTAGAYLGSVPAPGQGFGGATYAYVAEIDPAVASGTVCLDPNNFYGFSFNALLPGTTSSQSLQVTNCGEASLTFSSITSSNVAFTVPSGKNACTGSLAVGASCSFTVNFTPTAAQSYSAAITIKSNATVGVTSIAATGSGGEPSASFDFVSGFQPLIVGQTSPTAFFELRNSGPVALAIDLAKVSVSGDFALAPGGNCTASVFPGGTCDFFVVFKPTAAGTRTGVLSVPTNDPQNPMLTAQLSGIAYTAYPLPTITSLMNPSYPINSGPTPITMTVSGSNFFPASVVFINGVAQTTVYQSSTSLSVTFQPSLINAVGEIPVTVVNPTPGGGSSGVYPLIGYNSIALTASALTVDPVGGLLYAAIPASASKNPSTIIPINPATGATTTPITVSSDPRTLAVSDDGSELYVASAGVLQRINLKTQAIEKTFDLPVDPEWGQTYVHEMHVVPGSPKSVVVVLFANVDPAEDGAALYNDSGLVNWIPGQAAVNGANTLFWLDSFTFTSSPSTMYGLPEAVGDTFFMEIPVSPSGISRPQNGNGGETSQQTGSIVRSDGRLLYTNAGQVWNPSTKKLLGTYLEADGTQLFYAPTVLPDAADGRTYFLDFASQYSQYQALSIDVYNQADYSLVGTVPFTSIYPPDGADLVRWGSNGFAFRSVDTTGADPGANQIVIVTSSLVSSTGAAPVPVLASVSPDKVIAGGAAYTMQLTGSGFTKATTVLINGNARATTYVSGTSLSAQVLASDFPTVGQINVQVTTPAPGGGTSNVVVVSVDQAPQNAPTVTLAPSAISITTAQPLTVNATVSTTGTLGTPTGSVVLTANAYTSSPVTLAGGTASIVVPAGSLAMGGDRLIVTYTPDAASAFLYSSASGTTTVTVTAPAKIASTVTAVAAASTITDSQTDAVSITVAGQGGQPAPTGTVTLSSGDFSAQQVLSSAAASITIPSGKLSSGANTITATYSGDTVYSGSNTALTITVTSLIVSAPTPAPVAPGASATTSVSLSAGSTYSGTLNLSCTLASSPANAQSLPTCSLNPTSIAITASGNGTAMMTVKTTAATNSALAVPNSLRLLGVGSGMILAGLLWLGIPARRRRWLALAVFASFLGAAGFLTGCGGGGSSSTGPTKPGTPATTAGTYKFTIAGTDSANSVITASTIVNVVVQ